MELDSVDLVKVSNVTTFWPCSTRIKPFRLVELVECFLVLHCWNGSSDYRKSIERRFG